MQKSSCRILSSFIKFKDSNLLTFDFSLSFKLFHDILYEFLSINSTKNVFKVEFSLIFAFLFNFMTLSTKNINFIKTFTINCLSLPLVFITHPIIIKTISISISIFPLIIMSNREIMTSSNRTFDSFQPALR